MPAIAHRLGALSTLLAICCVGCADEPPYEPPATVADFMRELRLAAEVGDEDQLRMMGKAVMPSPEDLRRILKPRFPKRANLIGRAERGWSRSRVDIVVRSLLAGRPEQTEVTACTATTEELVAYTAGSPVWREFRREMSLFVKVNGHPGVTWIKVQRVVPGEKIGLPIYGFVQLDDRYVFLGTPWQLGSR